MKAFRVVLYVLFFVAMAAVGLFAGLGLYAVMASL